MRKRVILLALMLGLASWVWAQSGVGTFVNYFETTEGNDAFQLDLFFNLVDGNQQVVPGGDVQALEVMLDDGSQYQASVVQPEVPFYIAIVLDASGSMTAANADMRAAAIGAVESAPDLAQFAVIPFSEQVEVAQGFTPDRSRTRNTIDQVRSVPDGGTCLYDAAAQALNQIGNQPRGRRAIILFTDGVDEIRDGIPCSTTPLSSVLETATDPDRQTPIYVVGMEGSNNSSGTSQINRTELERIATETGGFVAFGTQGNLGSLFGSMMQALSNQYLAQVQMYPPAGQRTATVTALLDGDVRAQPTTITFNVTGNYAPPFSLTVDGLVRQPTNMFDLQLSTVGTARVSSFTMTIVDENGFTVSQQDYGNSVPQVLQIDGNQLTPGQSYEIRLSATNERGENLLTEWEPLDFTMPAEGDELTPVRVQITDVQLNEESQELQVNLSTLGSEQVNYLDVKLERDGITVEPYRTTGAPEQLQLDISDVPGGEYELVVMPFDFGGMPLTESPVRRGFSLPVSQPIVQIEAVSVNDENDQATVDLISRNVEPVQALRVWATDSTGQRLDQPIELEGVPENFAMGITPNVGENEYRLNVMPLDSSGGELYPEPAQTQFTVIYRRSLLERIGGILLSPIVLAILVGSSVAIGAFLFFQQRTQSTSSQTQNRGGYIQQQQTNVIDTSSSGQVGRGSGDENTLSGVIMREPRRATPDKDTKKGPRQPRGKVETDRLSKAPFGSNDAQSKGTEVAPYEVLATVTVKRAQTNLPQTIDITQPNITIGREGDLPLRFVADGNVSRRHLQLKYDESQGTFLAKDISSGGTAINGQLFHKSRGQTTTLLPRDQENVIDLSQNVRITIKIH